MRRYDPTMVILEGPDGEYVRYDEAKEFFGAEKVREIAEALCKSGRTAYLNRVNLSVHAETTDKNGVESALWALLGGKP